MIDIVVYSVFILALIAFSLSPAIYLTSKLSSKVAFVEANSTKVSIVLAVLFSTIATFFIFLF